MHIKLINELKSGTCSENDVLKFLSFFQFFKELNNIRLYTVENSEELMINMCHKVNI